MKDQPMPEAIKGLVRNGKTTDCHTTKNLEHRGKNFAKDFEPGPNVSVYDNGIKSTKDNSFAEDFEPRPNVSVYDDDSALKGEKSFTEDFEPRPNVSVYDNDVDPKEKTPFSIISK